MGYVKYKEDDSDAIAERVFIDTDRKVKILLLNQSVLCHYCDRVFASIEERNRHVKHDHKIFAPILIVNGRVVHNKVYIYHLEQVLIDLCGFDQSKIFFNGVLVQHGNPDDVIDLLAHVLPNAINTVSIDSTTIFIHHIPSMNFQNKIVETVIRDWGKTVEEGKYISKNYPDTLNKGEKDYLDGLFNYYIACVSKKNKAQRYEDAYSILSSFDKKTAISLCVLRIIAYRLNWVEILGTLRGTDNVFDLAWRFLTNEVPQTQTQPFLDDGKTLLIENSVESSLNAIVAFQKSNYDEVNQYLLSFSNDELSAIEDTNLKDKIFLLKARMAIKDSQFDEAYKWYNEIISPFFNFERDEFIEKHKK